MLFLMHRLKQLLPIFGLLLFLPIIIYFLPQAVQYIGRASGVPANIQVDAEGFIGPMPHPWRNLAQGGEESTNMLAPVTGEIAKLQTEYVRIDHIYDLYNVVGGSSGNLTYDWSKLDAVLNDITKSGAKPFIALSYMPPAISKGDIVDLPNNWGDWQAVVRATVEHISGRAGLNISDVYYEVWNEPDLFGGWKTYGSKNYLDLYLYAARGAQSASNVNYFKIGGPATTALYLNWVNNFLNFAQSNNLPVDFVSWHRYDYDLDVFEKDAASIRSWVESHPQYADIEYMVTEWGHDPENHAGYDTNFGAAFTIAGSIVMSGPVNRAFVFEVKDGPGPEQYWGRWGLLTHEKWGTPVEKPRFKAIQLLNTLGDQRISVGGQGSWVKGIAAWKDNQLQTLLVNYDSAGKHVENVPVTFVDLPSGNFVYQRTDFLGRTTSYPVSTTSSSWKVQELMNPNTAAMITLSF